MTNQHVTSGKRGRRKPAPDPHINRYKANIGAPFHCYRCGKKHRNIGWEATWHCVRKVIDHQRMEKLKYQPYVYLGRDYDSEYKMHLFPQRDYITMRDLAGTKFRMLEKTKIWNKELFVVVNVANILAVSNERVEINRIKKEAVGVMTNHKKQVFEILKEITEQLKCQT